MIFGKRDTVPAEVLTRAGLTRAERVLAQAPSDDGTWLLGTRDALVVVEPAETIRLAWETLESADWDRDTGRLEVAEVGEFGQPRPVHRFTLGDPRRLLQLVRERVTASVLLQRRVGDRPPSAAGQRGHHLGLRARPGPRPGGPGRDACRRGCPAGRAAGRGGTDLAVPGAPC